ncbi:MAG: FMN-binding protein [Lachnospiraceae bacterium]|nr:FMN-binding protein [Clostridiales bacterium]MBR6850201.1 FMN-binding protein [Lachnospiraceae bacterium]
MQKLKGFLPAIVLALICSICVFLLAGTYALTKDKIADQEKAAAQERKLTIFPDARSFEPLQYSDSIRNELKSQGIDPDEAFVAYSATGDALGYIFVNTGFGYAGNIVTTTGIDSKGKIIMVIATAASDTPKLGKEVEGRPFLDGFTGLSTESEIILNQDVAAVSGATISSRAATACVNRARSAYRVFVEKGLIA